LLFAVALAFATAWALEAWGGACDYAVPSRIEAYLCLHPRLHFFTSLLLLVGLAVAVGRRLSAVVRGVSLLYLAPLILAAWGFYELRMMGPWLKIPVAVNELLFEWALFIPVALTLVLLSRTGLSGGRGRRTKR
jgi:hypothetical protein